MAGTGPLNVAIVGCGNISAAYSRTMAEHPDRIRLTGAFDLRRETAAALVEKYGGKVYDTLDDVLTDPEVELVVNLTIHQAHNEVISKCLHAGKHVHTEKPLTLDVNQAMELVKLAHAKKLRLSSAPITFLGEGQQTAWKLIRDGVLGEVRVIYAEMNWGRIESWHPNPSPFYEVGALADVGVYPLTLLTTIFGPVERVTGFGKVVKPVRDLKDGGTFEIKSTPDWACAGLQFASGPICRLTGSFYVGPTLQHGIEFHGDAASMALSTPHDFNGEIKICKFGEKEWTPQPLVKEPYAGVEWARGVTELHDAIREDRPHRCTGEQAAHVVEVIFGAYRAATSGESVEIKSRFTQPAPMEWAV